MIDTDKYEGHTEGKRELKHNAFIHIEGRGLYATVAGGFTTADRLLMADAPLLLAEVKRLREQLAKANKYVHSICQHSDSMLMDYEDYMKGDD